MIEETVQVTRVKTTLNGLSDAVDLLNWALTKEGLYATVSARTDGVVYIEVGGVTVDSKQAELGDTITWDGAQFTVSRP